MPTDRKTVDSLVAKLQELYFTLSEEEQSAFDDLLQSAHIGMTSAAVAPFGIRSAEIGQLNELLEEAKVNALITDEVASWTTVTITTTVASHPIITCQPK